MKPESQPKTQLRDSVLVRFMLGFHGHSLPGELAEYLALGLAGVVIYQRNFASALGLQNLLRNPRGRETACVDRH